MTRYKNNIAGKSLSPQNAILKEKVLDVWYKYEGKITKKQIHDLCVKKGIDISYNTICNWIPEKRVMYNSKGNFA